MSDEQATTTTQETAAETTTASTSESTGATGNESQAGDGSSTTEGESKDAARTGAQQVSGGTAAPASPNPPISSDQIAKHAFARYAFARSVVLGDDVIYVAGPEDEGHGGIIPGEKLAAIVVMEGPFPNLKVFCSTTDATLLKKGVPFGNDPGQWHF